MTATTPPAPPNPLAPSAEPQIYVGIITSILVSAGLVTTGEATTLQPLLLAVIVALPTVLAIIQRQFATPNAKVAVAVQQAVTAATVSTPPVTTAPATPPPAPVTTSTGSTSVALTVVSSTDLPSGTEGSIAAGTRRWSLDGTQLSDVGPALVTLTGIDNVTGDIHGHFYRTGTQPPYYLVGRDVSVAVAATPTPAAPVDPYRGLPALTTNDAIVAFEAQPGIAAQEDAAFARFDAALAAYQAAHNQEPGKSEPQAVMIAIAESVNASILRYAGKFGPENNTYSR